jgi:hypothetical protein
MFCRSSPGLTHLERRPVAEPAVPAVVVAVDVAADPLAGAVEGLVFVQPYLPFFEFPEPALDQGLRFGVAVAAAAVTHTLAGEPHAERARLDAPHSQAVGRESRHTLPPRERIKMPVPVLRALLSACSGVTVGHLSCSFLRRTLPPPSKARSGRHCRGPWHVGTPARLDERKRLRLQVELLFDRHAVAARA